MIFFKSKRINELEMEVGWLNERKSDLQNQVWNLQRDLSLVTKYLNLNFEDLKATRRLVKKGGPEKGE